MIGTDIKEWREGAMETALNTGVTRALGRCQIFFGAASVVFQVVLIAINSDRGVPFLAAGIWSGVFFLLAGSAAIAAAYRPTRCNVITLMVLSIISAISAVFGLFVCSVLDIHVTRRNCEFFDYFSEIYYDENDAGPSATPIVLPHIDDDDGILWGVVGGGHRHVYGVDGELEIPSRRDSRWFACSRSSYVMALILDSFLLVFAVVSTIASIWCSVLCCRAVCFPDPHPRFLYFSPTTATGQGVGDATDASFTTGCATSVPVAVVTHPAAAVVCLPITNGAVTSNGIVASSSQYLANGSLYTSSTEFLDSTAVVTTTMTPILTSTTSISQHQQHQHRSQTGVIIGDVNDDHDEPPSYDASELPPYQPNDSRLPHDLDLPPYNPHFVNT